MGRDEARKHNLGEALRYTARRFEMIAAALAEGDVGYDEASSMALAVLEWVSIHPVRSALPRWASSAANEVAA